MALPNKTDLQTMDYRYMGKPFVSVPAKSSITTGNMDTRFMGMPFVSNEFSYGVSSLIKTVNALAKTSIKTVNSLAIASVKTINGLS